MNQKSLNSSMAEMATIAMSSLLEEISPLLESRIIGRKILKIVLLSVGTSLLMYSLADWYLEAGLTSGRTYLLAYSFVAISIIAILKSTTDNLLFFIATIFLPCMYLVQLTNTHYAIIIYPAIIVLIHVFTKPNYSLLISSILLVGVLVTIFVDSARFEIAVTSRAMLTNVIVLSTLQLIIRYNLRLLGSMNKVLILAPRMIHTLILDNQDKDTELDRQTAVDSQSGRPNLMGFLQQLEVIKSEQDSSEVHAVLLVRFANMMEQCASQEELSKQNIFPDIFLHLENIFPAVKLCRVGEWDFGIILTGQNRDVMLEGLESRLQTLRSQKLSVSGVTLHVRIAAGLSWFGHADGAIEAVNHARIALTHAIETTSLKACIYSDNLRQLLNSKTQLLLELNNALSGKEYLLIFQPIIRMKDGVVSKAEALIRWQHPTRGLLGPGEFIPVAEDFGFIIEITRWVIRESAASLLFFRQRLGPDFQISLNIPVQYLNWAIENPEIFHNDILSVTDDERIRGGLIFEVTESSFIKFTDELQDLLVFLKQQKISIAIDDFGTGYSSLSTLSSLQEFNLSYLKIDKIFVDDIVENSKKRRLFENIVQIAHNYELEAVAEGIESGTQIEEIPRTGCEYGQGFAYSRPLRVSQFLQYASQPHDITGTKPGVRKS